MSRWQWLNPLFLFDFLDVNGRPDHQKIMAAAVVAGVFWCQASGKPLDTTTVIALGAIGFGPRLFGMFLRTGKWNASTETKLNVDAAAIAAIVARRQGGDVEPAP